tara:strand:- start:48 stop:374 length:327 start_codon:yes stop_codon:yes gene_type:complete
MPKYKNKKTAVNSSEKYEEMFKKRGREKILQTRTMPFTGLDFDSINATPYVWKSTDSLHKISQFFYGTIDFWWVIAFVNKKPTDAHYNIGDEIYIPTDPFVIHDHIGG